MWLETFEVSRALQKKIHVGCTKQERAADLLPAAWVLAVRPSHGLDTANRVRFGFPLDDATSAFLLPLADASKRAHFWR